MNWSDEKYVKLYTRQTATWRMWPWQARALFPLLLQVADGAGVVDVGGRDPLQALAVLVMIPREVVEPGVEALLADGTVEQVVGGFLIPKFVEAQEARKTESRKKADQRQIERDKRRVAQVDEIRSTHVPQCPAVSPGVPLQPSPAQHSPLNTGAAVADAPAPQLSLVPSPPPSPPEVAQLPRPPRPRESDVLVADFEAVMGAPYLWGGAKDGAAWARLRKTAPLREVRTRWLRGLAADGWLHCATVSQLGAKWNDLAAQLPAKQTHPERVQRALARFETLDEPEVAS